MSAFYALAFDDRVELLTDGAIYADDGTLLDIRRKVWTSDRLPLAITGRGHSGMVEAMATAMLFAASIGSFDEAVERIDGVLRRRAEKGAPADFEVVLVGISESRGPVIYYAASRDVHGAGFEPWRLHDVGREFGGGNVVDVSDLYDGDGLLNIGVELFERMRAVPGPNPTRPDLPDLYGIGGHIDWTVVAANGAETMRIWEWPDVIGEPIDPKREGREPGWFDAA